VIHHAQVRAREELRLAGARPCRIALNGRDALTAGERRVVDLACEDMTNKQIAQALFLTQRTVEMHLTNAYQKLEISSRDQLASALGED
jgi:DNA-binding CsgD family transcriptional regulator